MGTSSVVQLPPTTFSPEVLVSWLESFVRNVSEDTATIAVRTELARLAGNNKVDEDRLTPRADLCAELDICDQTAINWEKRGIVTAHRIGRRVFYRRSEVMAALMSSGLARPDGTRRNARRGQKQKPR